MTFLDLAKERYSVRKFDPRPVEQEKIDLILEAAKVAPSAVNYQCPHIYVLKSAEALEKVPTTTRYAFHAPLNFLICYDKTTQWVNRYDPSRTSGEVDASIVATHMMMEAWELGLGSCWVGSFDPAKVVEAFQLPENMVPVAMLPMGYPSAEATPLNLHSIFKPMDEFVTYL